MRPADRNVLRCVLLLLLLGAAFPPRAAAGPTRVTGRVIDADTQAPVAGALVELANTSGGQGYFRARTNARGEFAIEGAPSERWYTLTAGADDYADFAIRGWQFPSAQRAVNLVVPLDRAGSIEIAVTRSDGRTPVTGAKVTVEGQRSDYWWEGYVPPPPPAFTDARGTARFAAIRAGTYAVTVEAPVLRPTTIAQVRVRRGQPTRVPVRLVRPASLSGTVRLADGTPVEGVAVQATGPGTTAATTDADGAFTLGDLEPGRYRVTLQHDGFEPLVTKEPVVLAEGAERGGVALTATPLAAQLAFVLEREAILPRTTARIGVRSFRIAEIELTLFRIPEPLLLETRSDFRALATGADTTGLVRVSAWKHIHGGPGTWAWREGEITVPEDLAPGAYVLRGRAGTTERRVIFFVTDLGLVVKRSPSHLLVSAASLRGGEAVAGARVFTLARHPADPGAGEAWAQAVDDKRGLPPVETGDDGLVVVPAPNALPPGVSSRPPGTGLRLVAVSDEHGIAVVDAPLAGAAEQGGDRAFLYTDRPIYRPGHTVNWKAFVRVASGDGYALPDASGVSVTLNGPDGSSIDAPPAAAAPGAADGSFALPADAALGEWTLSARAGRAAGSATFAVLEYRKPEFRVEVAPGRAIYVNGDEMRFRVAASYFFGAPVFGATVRYNLFETRLVGEFGGEDLLDEGGGGYGRVIKTGEARTDLDGRIELVFAPDRVAYDRRLTLEVETVDASSRVVSARGSALMGRGLFTIAVRPLRFVVRTGEPVAVEVATHDLAGAPVAAEVTVELDQEAWNPIERRYTRSTRPLASLQVTTNREGRARVSLTPSPARPGPIVVRARAEDARRNRIAAQAQTWAWDEAVTEYSYRYPALEVLADRDRYRPGDTVSVLVNSDARNAAVLATLEGRDLYERRTVTLHGGTALVRFPLTAEHAPNVFVAVHVRKGREVHSRTIEIPVEGPRHDLAISLTPDRAQYGPRDSARVTIETRDAAGRPVPAELSLAVVDEAIFALRADDTADPHEAFYGRRPNWVSTSFSFPLLTFGGAAKDARPEPRRDFRDVALWAPAIRTGPDGRGSAAFRFPDNLTTWRLTSRGATATTDVGDTVVRALVTQDVVARLAGPRFFLAGDEPTVVSMVTNRTGEPLPELGVTLAATGAVAPAGPDAARLSLPARGEGRCVWPLRVAAAPRDTADATLTLRVRRTGAGVDADAIEIAVPVRPRAVPLARGGAGTIDDAGRTIAVALPDDLVRTGSHVTLDFSPSPAAMALAAVDWLGGYPYGCTEQTANAILPAVALLAAFRAAGVEPPGWSDPAARLAPYFQRLAATQIDGGGWSWWRRGDYDPYLTALAIDALARGARLGLAPPEATGAMTSGVYRVLRSAGEIRTLDGEAYALAHLAPVLELDDWSGPGGPGAALRALLEDWATHLHARRAELSSATLALAAQGVAALNWGALAKEMVAALLTAGAGDGGLHWTSALDGERGWYGGDVEATAYALSAIARVTPQEPRAAEAVRWLAARRSGRAWPTTRTSGPAAVALADYLAARPAEAKPDHTLRVDWNGERVLERRVEPADALGREPVRVRIPGAKLRPGDNRLAVARQGAGSVYWSWEARALVSSPGPEPADRRLRVAREYLRAERAADRRGRPRLLATPLETGEAMRVGEAILVRLTLTAGEALDHVMVEDPRVSGFEVDALEPEGAERPWNANAEERDDRVAFFVDRLPEGETVIEYLVRPELAGSFTALPATAGGMYDPALQARSGEARVRVAGR
jgi:hypothetical protein